MKTLVIVCHPDLKKSRHNRALAEAVAAMPEVMVHDLQARYPDENIDVPTEQELLLAHERIVLQFPFYWYSTPSLLKKWQDQVLSFGWAYGPGGDKLNGKEILVATTTGGPEHAYVAGGYNRYSMSELLRPLQAMANLVGAKYLIPFVAHSNRCKAPEELEAMAKAYASHVQDPKLSRY
jgi:glutathione-regulated potassium-efflux system ancillary protein KefG